EIDPGSVPVQLRTEKGQLRLFQSAKRAAGEHNLTAEREAEGQQNLPGTDRIGQGELARRRIVEPLKPRVEQKPMDIGLFGDDSKLGSLFQRGELTPRGRITLQEGRAIVDLFANADQSTFMHEMGHKWLDEMIRDAAADDAPADVKQELASVLKLLGVEKPEDVGTAQHEQWARGFEQYLAEGKAPSSKLAAAFAKFKDWLLSIYHGLVSFDAPLSDDVRRGLAPLLASDREIAEMRQAPPHPAQVLADLPQRVQQDVVHAAAADIIAGRPVRAGEMLTEAAKQDPRIGESLKGRAAPAGDDNLVLTGRPQVDAVLQDPKIAQAIRNPNIERKHTVPYEAGASAAPDDMQTHLDEHLPPEATVSGVTFDPGIPANIHEQVEKEVMERLIAQFRAQHGREPNDAEIGKIYEIAHHEFA